MVSQVILEEVNDALTINFSGWRAAVNSIGAILLRQVVFIAPKVALLLGGRKVMPVEHGKKGRTHWQRRTIIFISTC